MNTHNSVLIVTEYNWEIVPITGLEYQKNKLFFTYFSTETYVVGTQKNRLNETVLLSTQNICLN